MLDDEQKKALAKEAEAQIARLTEELVKSVPVTPIKRDDDLFAKALDLAFNANKPRPRSDLILNIIYYVLMTSALAWVFAMSIDRNYPVEVIKREIVNEGGRVPAGEQLLVRVVTARSRVCEMTRRWAIVDGHGRRFDFEPERFDAYGPLVRPSAAVPEATGPHVPLDAAPGRGRFLSILAWDCNLLQRALGWSIVMVQPVLEFEILPRKDASTYPGR